jgi:hypothetical protein
LHTENPALSREVQRFLEKEGFKIVVTVRDYDYPLIWGLPDSTLRHYQCKLAGYPDPEPLDLQELCEFCLYEIHHKRRVPIWVENDETAESIANALCYYFASGTGHISQFIRLAMATQKYRNLVFLNEEKVFRCRFCIERGCFMDLVCHAESPAVARQILETGKILSPVKARGLPGEILARQVYNPAYDPPDYFEDIKFAAGNCPGPDKLVFEQDLGRLPSWEEYAENFIPAVKFMFRTKDLIMHPNFCFDGYHPVRIHDELPLEPLLVAVVIPQGLPESENLMKVTLDNVPPEKIIHTHYKGYDPREWGYVVYKLAKKRA